MRESTKASELEKASKTSLVIIHLLAVIGLLFFCKLGFWQLDRASEKQILQESFDRNHLNTVSAITSADEFAAVPDFQQLSVQTKWLPEATFLLDSQIHNGKVGVYVFTPVEIQEAWLLVNRGFLPLPASRLLPERDLAEVLHVEGVVELTGKKWLWPQAGLSLDGNVQNRQGVEWWSNINSDALRQHYQLGKRQVLNKVVLLDPDQSGGFERDFQIVNSEFGPNKHRAYAIQWFSFAAIIIFLLIGYWFRLRKNTQTLQSSN